MTCEATLVVDGGTVQCVASTPAALHYSRWYEGDNGKWRYEWANHWFPKDNDTVAGA